MSVLPRNQIQSGGSVEGVDSDDTYGPRILIACCLVEVLSTVLITLRFYCKLKRARRLWWDDYILASAWLFQTCDVALISINVGLGEGQHVWRLSRGVLSTLGLNGNVSGTLSIIAACLSKTSFGLTLLRLTAGLTRKGVIFLIVSMNIALGLSALFIWLQCDPPAKAWSPDLDGTCWDPSFSFKYGVFSGAYSAFTDLVLSILPWPLIWRLQMETKEKVGVAVAISMGVFSAGAAVAKTVQLRYLSRGDFTYYESEVVIWGTVETAVAIMAASVPFLRVLVVEAQSAYARRDGVSGGSGRTRTRGAEHTDNAAGASEVVLTSDKSPYDVESSQITLRSGEAMLADEGREGQHDGARRLTNITNAAVGGI
ncbi:hypothetical protein B0T24DRAFT_701862 [Lasiosphaeria ovina]|uniref:Rhodopsin domain-containing protein n=1 Tax=Lasiosphaeria ovina TaxID=92902 RepID=A0AAE0NBJ4_9PEZI|nr:hypothetical protein B0T24DRAFT_701862 [Lasiosphaeria ovina]